MRELSSEQDMPAVAPGTSRELNIAQVVAAIRSVLPPAIERVSLHEPWFNGQEREYVLDCIDTGWVSSVGQYVDRFEQMLAEYAGVERAVAIVNGTSALHLCLKLAGVVSGDEVLVPDLTFVATANAVVYCGAIPHFVDSEETTLGLDPNKLHHYLSEIAEVRNGASFNRFTGARIAAVVPMHTFGIPVDIDALEEVCRRFSLVMVEDAAESLGSTYRGKHTGSFGTIAALSFNGNKIVTCGGGGAILTNDTHLGALAKHLSTTARVPDPWTIAHDAVGYNYRMPNLNAALGCAQLEQLPAFVAHKRSLADRYVRAFAGVQGIRVVTEPLGSRSNYWLNCLRIESGRAEDLDRLLAATHAEGILSRPAWTLMHNLPMYRSSPRMDVSVAETLASSLINLPSSAFLDPHA